MTSAVAFAQTPEQATTLTADQYLQEGNRYSQAKQYDKAVESFRQAIKLNPSMEPAFRSLGVTYGRMGRVPDSLEPLKTAVQLDPNDAFAHLYLGTTLAILRRPDEALAELNEAKRLKPDEAGIHMEIGNVLHNSFGRIEDALNSYIEARRLNPNIPAIHHNIGLMYMRLGRFSDAIAPLREALRLEPNYRNARYLLSDTYSKLGRYDEAVDSWTKFLQLVPNGPEALTKRSWNYMYWGGHGREAADDARTFLNVHGWRQQTSLYLVIIANLGYRGAGLDQDAAAILEEATSKVNTGNWPYPVINYLKGATGPDDLLQQATDNNKKTEANAYIGMDLLLKGKQDDAIKHFNWVRSYGNKQFFEYPLAIEELKRMGR
jgi:tetratricopeptide (TPR) repeat protein